MLLRCVVELQVHEELVRAKSAQGVERVSIDWAVEAARACRSSILMLQVQACSSPKASRMSCRSDPVSRGPQCSLAFLFIAPSPDCSLLLKPDIVRGPRARLCNQAR